MPIVNGILEDPTTHAEIINYLMTGQGGTANKYSVPKDGSQYAARNVELLQRGAKYYDEPLHVVLQYGTWAVTTEGIACLDQSYFIAADRLFETWVIHLAGKGFDMWDCARALKAGQLYHHGRCSDVL